MSKIRAAVVWLFTHEAAITIAVAGVAAAVANRWWGWQGTGQDIIDGAAAVLGVAGIRQAVYSRAQRGEDVTVARLDALAAVGGPPAPPV